MIQSGGTLLKPSELADQDRWPGVNVMHLAGGLGLSGHAASYGHIYKSQLWVYVVVNKLAAATARLPLKIYERADLGRTERRDHPYAQLLRHPNPKVDPFFLWQWTESTLNVYGDALWVKLRPSPDRPPMELWPWHPANVGIERENGELVYVDLVNRDRRYLATDIVHFKTYNPDGTTRGLSPLEPLRQTLLNEDAARRATSSFWLRGARPGVALTHPGNLSKPAADRLKEDFNRVAGGADKTGETVVLEEGMKPEIMTLSAEEAQYIETRRINREEVCGAYDVPPPVVHILDRATFSNITEQMRSLYRDTMAPRLSARESVLATQLQPDFGTDAPYAEFLMDDVLRGDFEKRTAAYQQATYMTIAEKRAAENLPPIAGTDRLFIQSAEVPLDAMDAVVAERAQLTPVETRSVLGRLSRPASLSDIDPDALVKGLNGSAATVLAELEASVAGGETVPELRQRVRALGGPS